ncbi:CCHC-type domain-containing protein [Nephila pilipes]|uniref:CCHC-type domain-containing protein n=1 Tax=Nephila pilipes TaxID=299642 RepID=A0A8X6NEP7_NEPPI|nr:CCHC-type domain-containing protein [Nephila pilipes]
MLNSETATHLGFFQGEEWYKFRNLGKQCDIFYSSKGKSYDGLRDVNGMIVKREVLRVIGINSRTSTIYLKGIFGPATKCPLVYVPIGVATGGQFNVVYQQVLCALAEVLVEDVLLPPDVLDMLEGAQSEENSLAQSSQDLGNDS